MASICNLDLSQNIRRGTLALRICHFTISVEKPTYKLPTIRPYPVEPITLGDYLRKKRLDLNLKQEDLAKELNTTTSSISNWERNDKSQGLKHIPRIIRFIGFCPYEVTLRISKKLIIWRIYNGISQKKMARLVGVDPSTLGRWEQGKRNPNNDSIKKIQMTLKEHLNRN